MPTARSCGSSVTSAESNSVPSARAVLSRRGATCSCTKCGSAGSLDDRRTAPSTRCIVTAARRRPGSSRPRRAAIRHHRRRPRAAHEHGRALAPGSDVEAAVDARLRAVPPAQPGAPPHLQRLAGPAGQRPERPRATRPTTGRSSTGCARSTSGPRPIVRRVGRARRALRRVPAPPARRTARRSTTATRVVHVAAHRLVPHRLDAAPRGSAARARPIARARTSGLTRACDDDAGMVNETGGRRRPGPGRRRVRRAPASRSCCGGPRPAAPTPTRSGAACSSRRASSRPASSAPTAASATGS